VRVDARIGKLGAPLAAFGLGALLSLALAPWHHLWGVPLAVSGAAWLYLRCRGARPAALIGWALGLGYFTFGLSWIIEPFQIDAERYAWMAPFALIFLAAGLALFWGAAFGLAAKLGRGRTSLLLLCTCWSLAEFARAYVLTGFPWAGFGQFWIETRAVGLLPWIGPHGLALLTLLAFAPLSQIGHRRLFALAPLAASALLVLALPEPPEAALSDKQVRLVQPNAPQAEKWHPQKRWVFVRRAVELSAAPGDPDLVIWPETTLPLLLNDAGATLAQIAQATGGVPLLTGIQREEAGRYYNSAILTDGRGALRQTYDKAHLVPFGEYVPFGDFMARFGIHGFASQAGAGYSAGPGGQLLDLPLGRALPLICYEAVFPQDVNAAKARPDMLVQITNDAWFGTRSGPYQHLVQARMRAAEQGLSMLRAANTGITAIIDPYGRVLQSLPLGQSGALDGALPLSLPPTFYSKSGDWPVFLFCLALLLALGLRQGRNMADRS